MSVSVSSRSVRYASGVQKRSGTGAAYNKSKAAGVVVDTADSSQMKFNKAGTVVTVADSTNLSTLQNAAGVTTSGAQKVAIVTITGAAWHTGNGTADYLSWTNPEAGNIIIHRAILYGSTVSTGAATADIGVTASNNHTNDDTLLDAVNLATTAPFAIGNILASGVDTELPQVVLATGKWVTLHALADPTGFVGKLFIHYTIA